MFELFGDDDEPEEIPKKPSGQLTLPQIPQQAGPTIQQSGQLTLPQVPQQEDQANRQAGQVTLPQMPQQQEQQQLQEQFKLQEQYRLQDEQYQLQLPQQQQGGPAYRSLLAQAQQQLNQQYPQQPALSQSALSQAKQPLPLSPAQLAFFGFKKGNLPLRMPSIPRIDLQPISQPYLPDGTSPSLALGFQTQEPGESRTDYGRRIYYARRALGFFDKEELLPDEVILSPSALASQQLRTAGRTHPRTTGGTPTPHYFRATSRIHLAKLTPSHEMYDPDYTANWYANKEARRKRNNLVTSQLNDAIRAWNLRNPRQVSSPLLEMDDDKNDDLYPSFEYIGTAGISGRTFEFRSPPGILAATDKDALWRRSMSKFKCEFCRSGEKFCSILDNGTIPCENCITRNKPCTGGQAVPQNLRINTELPALPERVIIGRTAPRRKNLVKRYRERPVLSERSELAGEMSTNPYPRASPGNRPPRGRSASPLREVEQRCDKCVERGEECDMGRPCRSCVTRGESFLCDASVQGQAYGREFDSEKAIFGNQESLPPMSREEQALLEVDRWNKTLSSLVDMGQVSPPHISSQQGIQAPGEGTPATPSIGRDTISPYSEARDTFASFGGSGSGLSVGDSINRTIQNSSFGGNSTTEREMPYRPQQEMQNAASTWGLQDRLDPPAPADPIIVDETMVDVGDLPMDLDLNEFLATATAADFPGDPNSQNLLDVPGPGVERAFTASWVTRIGATALRHADVLSGYPDRGAGPILREREDTNCNEQKFHFLGADIGICERNPASHCEFLQVGQPEFVWQGPQNHVNPNPYHTCPNCHQEQEVEARNWEMTAKAGMKAFVCFGCSMSLTASAMTRYKTCVCLDKLNNDWLCHDHRAKGYDQITRASGLVGEWLISAGGGKALCPRCYVNYEDETSSVYTCKCCRTYVQDE